ncbi:MAG: hypothetical protein Kow0092_07220 [Deferrisomatales bacterium]
MDGDPRKRRLTGAAAGLAVWALLGGCSLGGGNAQAAQDKRVETFQVDPGSFQITAEEFPTVEVRDGATVYTLQSDGSRLFDETGGGPRSFALDSGDVIIERPAASTLTFIRQD